MPDHPKDIHLENLKETLVAAQRYFLSGSVSALFILSLASRGQLARGAAEQEVTVPGVGVSSTTFGAAFIALAVYFLSGWMILGFVIRLEHIKGQLIPEHQEFLDAALTYPSLLSTRKRMPAVLTLLVAALGTGAMLWAYIDSRDFFEALLPGLIVSLPYLIVAYYLLRWPLDRP